MATHADISGNLTIGPGQSIRRNAAGTAFEAFTAATSGSIEITAGSGLVFSGSTLNVGAGRLITVGADSVGVSNGTAQYQVPVTGGSPFAPAWSLLSTYAGSGLAFSSGAFNVGAGSLITVDADSVGVSNGTAQYQVPVTGGSPFASSVVTAFNLRRQRNCIFQRRV